MNRLLECFLATVLVLLLAIPGLNAADTFLGVHLGAASVRAADTDIRLDQRAIGKGDTSETFAVMGIRCEAWLERLPALGAAVDFTLNGEVAGSKLDPFDMLWSFSVLALYRMSFKESSLYPNGRIQPYIALGPGLFFTEIGQFFGPPDVSEIEFFSASSTDMGLDARAGLTWMLDPKFGVYAEYRYTQFETDYSQNIPDGTLRFNPELKSHSLLFGISWSF
jgi:opacity protein-like surface antigen